ncbi:hypothetical protein GCM10017562_08260 [Streptomyces roseofulvus]|uniref:hypothetical protein n=1 Tax=Streptomyces roseofulvus TaxID=33902 RepID=UPI0031F77332
MPVDAERYANCHIYVDAADPGTLVERLRPALGVAAVTPTSPDLVFGPLLVTGASNDYATGARAHPDDFLEWPVVPECDAVPGAAPAETVEAVSALLRCLWNRGYAALATCDFEDELPCAGGATRHPPPTRPSRGPGTLAGRAVRRVIRSVDPRVRRRGRRT